MREKRIEIPDPEYLPNFEIFKKYMERALYMTR